MPSSAGKNSTGRGRWGVVLLFGANLWYNKGKPFFKNTNMTDAEGAPKAEIKSNWVKNQIDDFGNTHQELESLKADINVRHRQTGMHQYVGEI